MKLTLKKILHNFDKSLNFRVVHKDNYKVDYYNSEELYSEKNWRLDLVVDKIIIEVNKTNRNVAIAKLIFILNDDETELNEGLNEPIKLIDLQKIIDYNKKSYTVYFTKSNRTSFILLPIINFKKLKGIEGYTVSKISLDKYNSTLEITGDFE